MNHGHNKLNFISDLEQIIKIYYRMLHLRHRQPWLLRNGIGLSMKAVEQEIAKAFCVFLNTIQFGKTTLRGRSFIINDVMLKFNNVSLYMLTLSNNYISSDLQLPHILLLQHFIPELIQIVWLNRNFIPQFYSKIIVNNHFIPTTAVVEIYSSRT